MARRLSRNGLIITSILGLAISFAVIFIISFVTSDFNLAKAWEAIKNANVWWILVAGAINLLSFVLETLQHIIIARAMGKMTSFWRMMRIYFLGLFFEYTSPSTSGGQPMQVWFLTDEDYTVAEATVLVTMKGLISVIIRILYVVIIFAMVPFGFNLNLQTAQYSVFLATVVGFLLLIAGGLIILAKPTWFSFVFKFLARFRLMRKWMGVKTPTAFYKKGKVVLTEVRVSAKMLLKRSKPLVALAVINSTVTWTLLKLMPYFVLLALGIKANILAVIAMGVIAQLSTAWVPTPGAVGGAEAGYAVFFMGIQGIASSFNPFLLIYRVLDYHMDILISGPFAISMLTEKLGKRFTNSQVEDIEHDIEEEMEHSQEEIAKSASKEI